MLKALCWSDSIRHIVHFLVPDDSFDSITCFCRKPFAGRPMIECSKCLVWLHLSCAKVRRNNIPDEFICQRCRDARSNRRKPFQSKTQKKRHQTHSTPSSSFSSSPSQSYHHHNSNTSVFSSNIPQPVATL